MNVNKGIIKWVPIKNKILIIQNQFESNKSITLQYYLSWIRKIEKINLDYIFRKMRCLY